MYAGQAAQRAHTHNRARTRVRCADRNAEERRGQNRNGRAGFGAERVHRAQAGNLLPHGFHNAPAARQRAQRNRALAQKHHA